MMRARWETPNHWLSASCRWAGTRASSTAESTGWKIPLSFARTRREVSTVIKTSTGLFAPSASIRAISSSAFASMRFTVMPVASSKSE